MTQEPEAPPDQLSTAQLIEQLSTQVSTLVRDEMALATAELKRKGARAGVGIGVSSVGGLLALYGLGTLIAAAVLGLAMVLDAWLAALIVGVVLLVVAGVLAATGVGQVRGAGPPMPEEAVRSTTQDVETVKKSVRR